MTRQSFRSTYVIRDLLTRGSLRLVAVAAIVALSSMSLQGAGQPANNRVRRAHLSSDLTRHEARRTNTRERVIVHGTDGDLKSLAARHRLKVVKHLRGAAVFLANSAELNGLSRDEAVDHLSGDVAVHGSTVTSDVSTGAEQTRAGNAVPTGLLGVPGVDGQGIGVAVV